MYLIEMTPAMNPADAYACIARRQVERVEIDHLEGRVTVGLVTPYPPGIPAVVPGERINEAVLDYLRTGLAAGMNVPDPADPSLRTVRVVA